jgi:late competence protein required for DNA uptake (superfamily II DNA/RNA helicase)
MKCRRTACNNQNADCKHTQTGEMYCRSCALKINMYNPLPDGKKLVELPVLASVVQQVINHQGSIVTYS